MIADRGNSCIRIINFDSSMPFKPEYKIAERVQDLFMSGSSRKDYRMELLKRIPVFLVSRDTMEKCFHTLTRLCDSRYAQQLSVYSNFQIRHHCRFRNKAHIPKGLPIIAVCPEIIAGVCLNGEENTAVYTHLAVTTIVNRFCHAYLDKGSINPITRQDVIIADAMAHIMVAECVDNFEKQSGSVQYTLSDPAYCFETGFVFLPLDSRIFAAELIIQLWDANAEDGHFLYDEWAENRSDTSSELYKKMQTHYDKMEECYAAHEGGYNKLSEEHIAVMHSFQYC